MTVAAMAPAEHRPYISPSSIICKLPTLNRKVTPLLLKNVLRKTVIAIRGTQKNTASLSPFLPLNIITLTSEKKREKAMLTG